jgi:hypothetical protein
MPIIVLGASKERKSETIKGMAIGEKDQYGNPFRIIKLRWADDRKNTDYTKTRGYEDAVIQRDRTSGGFRITYRKNGSIEWIQPEGMGPFFGEVAYTAYNMRKLAAGYGDKLWTIVDAGINAEVRAMYEKLVEAMPENLQEFNAQRIKLLHTKSSGGRLTTPLTRTKAPGTDPELEEQRKALFQKEQELKEREAKIKDKEDSVQEKTVAKIKEGAPAVGFSREALEDMQMFEVRRSAKSLGIETGMKDLKEDLINKILALQSGVPFEELTQKPAKQESIGD